MKKLLAVITLVLSLWVQVPVLSVHATTYELRDQNFSEHILLDGYEYISSGTTAVNQVPDFTVYFQLMIPYSPYLSFAFTDIDETLYISAIIFFDPYGQDVGSFNLADIYNIPGGSDPYSENFPMPGGLSRTLPIPKGAANFQIYIYGDYTDSPNTVKTLLNDQMQVLDVTEDYVDPYKSYEPWVSQTVTYYKLMITGYTPIPVKTQELLVWIPHGIGWLDFYYLGIAGQYFHVYANISFYDIDKNLIEDASIRLINNENRIPITSGDSRASGEQGTNFSPIPSLSTSSIGGWYYFKFDQGSIYQNAAYFTLRIPRHNETFTAAQIENFNGNSSFVTNEQITSINYRYQNLDLYAVRYFFRFPEATHLADSTNIDNFQYWLYRSASNGVIYREPLNYNNEYLEDITVFASTVEFGSGGDYTLPDETNTPTALANLLIDLDLFNTEGFVWIYFLLMVLVNLTLLFFFKIPHVILLAVSGVITAIFLFMNILPLYAVIILSSFFLISFLGIKGGSSNATI